MSPAVELLRLYEQHARLTVDETAQRLGWGRGRVLSWQSILVKDGCLENRGTRFNRIMALSEKGLDVADGRLPAPTYRSIYSKPKAPTPERKKRRCLMCREAFLSSGSGERVCRPCKGTSAWQSSAEMGVPAMRIGQ